LVQPGEKEGMNFNEEEGKGANMMYCKRGKRTKGEVMYFD
jgi:hypothetical protein